MLRLSAATGAVVLGVGAAVAPPAPPVPTRVVRLTSIDAVDAPLGGGTALIMGPSGVPTPSQTYADLVDSEYLSWRGFTGPTQILTTPEALYPYTGPFAETFDKSAAQGQQILDAAITNQIATGHVDTANPVVVFGWSQSSVISTMEMHQLADQGVPSDAVHFVLVGDESAPNGGLLSRFDLPAGTSPSIPSLGLTFSGAGPSDLYPADIYTHEYDGFADFPQYPINFLSVLNATLGIVFEHLTYLGLSPEDIQNAIQLPTSAADTLANYYMLPVDVLPLLAPLQLIPFIGNPLADLLNPDLSVLVNLGYGNVDDNYLGGWSHGFADVPTAFGFLPPLSVLEQVPQALLTGLQHGITDALADLLSPSNYVYALPAWANEMLKELPFVLDSKSSVLTMVPTTAEDLFGTFPPHTGIPPLDVATGLLITMPEYDYNVFVSELADGNLLDAIGIPLGADLGILPLALLGAAF